MTARTNPLYRQLGILLGGYLLVMGIMGFAARIGVNSLSENEQRLRQVVIENNEKFRLLTIMSDSIRDRMLLVYDLLRSKDEFEIDELAMEAQDKVRGFLLAREQLTHLGLTPTQKQQLDQQREFLSQAQARTDVLIHAAQNGQALESHDRILEARAANAIALQNLLEMQQAQKQLALDLLHQAQRRTNMARQQVFWLALAAALASLAVIWLTLRQITFQSRELSRLLGELHQSNTLLEQRVADRNSDLISARAENLQMSAELEVTRRLQRIVLPQSAELASNPHLEIAAHCEPADKVGGDYYDVLHSNHHTHISIGDVTGHGLESGVIMLMTHAVLRSQLACHPDDPVRVLASVNQILHQNVQRMDSDRYLTLTLVDYRYREGQGELRICGQHETLIILRTNGQMEEIDTLKLGFPVGLIEDITEHLHILAPIALCPGDLLVLYTDGITEAADPGHQLFGAERLKQVLREHRSADATDICDAVIRAVKQHVDTQKLFDDLTLLVVRQLG